MSLKRLRLIITWAFFLRTVAENIILMLQILRLQFLNLIMLVIDFLNVKSVSKLNID